MPSFTGKTVSSFYKNLFGINQSSNTGVDSTTRTIQDGEGNSTAIGLSDRQLKVAPSTNTTTAFRVTQADGSTNVLSADSDNNRVLAGASQVNVLTQYAYFSTTHMTTEDGYHLPIPFQSSSPYATAGYLLEYNLGNGTNPAASLDVSAEANDSMHILPSFWYISDNMRVTAVDIIMASGTASVSKDLSWHLMKYDFDTSSNFGDLSNGVVVADQDAVTSDVHQDAIKYKSLSVDPDNDTVNAGQVVLCVVEGIGGVMAVSATATVKFHIR